MGAEAKAAGWPLAISAALVGSCTDSAYEDLSQATSIANDAAAMGLTVKAPFMVTPGSVATMRTIQRSGFLQPLEAMGGVVLANACGPCIEQRTGDAATLAFVISPETVVALALAGTLDADPNTDTLTSADGDEVRLSVGEEVELADGGFEDGTSMFLLPRDDGPDIVVRVSPTSGRLQLLEPFAPWDGDDYENLPVLA